LRNNNKTMIFNYIDPLVFFIALGIGIFVAYILNPSPKIVHKYPTPDNSKKITYVDDESVCYKYNAEETDMPQDNSPIEILQ